MLVRLLSLLGLGDDVLQHLDEAKLTVQHPGLFWVGMALVACAGFVIYIRQRRNLVTVPRSLIVGLSLIRITILAVLVTVLAGPYLKIERRNEKKPIVALLFDDSQSMQLPAGPYTTDSETLRMAQAAGYRPTAGPRSAEAGAFLGPMSRGKLVQTVVQGSGPSFLEPVARKYELR